MELTDHIAAALAVTRDLADSLRAGDLVRCADLLEKRERILARFRDVHDASGEAEREAGRTKLAELVAADDALRSLADRERALAAAAWRDRPAAAAPRGPLTACLDRRA